MTQGLPELSIVIPAYNEEQRIGRGLRRLREYFASKGYQPGQVEVLVVNDGSKDRTSRVVQECAREWPDVRLVEHEVNHGKGTSVRTGMLEARGRLALFTDADLSAPIEESEKLFAALAAGNDAAIGSRALDRSLIFVHQSRLREMAGIVFNLLVRLLVGLPIHDTQCGFKAFVRERCRVIFEQQRIEGFGFDPEILFLARRHGLRTAEVPVRWANDPGTKVRVFRDSLRMLGDLFYIRWNWLCGRYPKK